MWLHSRKIGVAIVAQVACHDAVRFATDGAVVLNRVLEILDRRVEGLLQDLFVELDDLEYAEQERDTTLSRAGIGSLAAQIRSASARNGSCSPNTFRST